MAERSPQVNVRISPDLKAWLDTEAARNLRSVNSEILLAVIEKRQRTEEEPANK